jgi:hypothetical protein
MSRFGTLLLGFILFLSATSSHAGLVVDNHLFYFSNNVKTAADDKIENYYASICIGASIPKDFYLGWKSAFFSDKQQNASGTMTLSGLEMGPRAGYYLTKNHWTSFAMSYLPVFNGSHLSESGVSSKLSGSAFQFELNFAPDVFKGFSPGIALYYQIGNFTSSTNSTNTTSTVSYNRNGFYPTIYLHWLFGNE